jgi:hypothetical protein
MHHAKLIVLLLLVAACGAPNPCANVPCSEGRVCVVKGTEKVACEVPDAGAP